MTLEEAQKNVEIEEKISQKKEFLDEKVGKIAWKVFGIFVILYFIVTRFVQPVFASGESMEPTIHDGSIFLCNATVKKFNVDDIVVVGIPNKTPFDYQLIKRIVAVPGDSVEVIDGELYVNGIRETRGFEKMNDPGIAENKIVLSEGEYFVLGDNRNHSSDSRKYGIIKTKMIKGLLSKKCIETNFHLF